MSPIVRRSSSLALLVFGLAGLAQAQAPSTAATFVSSNGVAFQPLTDASHWTLTVTGPDGFVSRREGSRPPAFSLYDGSGNPVPDGTYQFELRGGASSSGLAANRPEASEETAADARAKGRRPGLVAVRGESPTVSGSFTVLGGAILVPSAASEEPRSRAPLGPTTPSLTVVADDQSIQGSLCVGLDCTPTESFGFDTIRLKENNTRIKFEDTSSSVGFPTVDWQLTANDSASGGADKFSIEDVTHATVPFTVSGSAPSDSLFISSTGRIGLRTTTPALDIHANTGDTPALRFEQNNSSGFTAQTWDMGGNEANFFIRDLTSGSRLPFRIRPGAPTSSIDIAANGFVGIGTPSPEQALHVKMNGNVLPVFQSADNNAVQFRLKSESPNRRLVALDGSNNPESQIVLGDNGAFLFLGPNAAALRAAIDTSGNLTIQGGLISSAGGGNCTALDPCDGVFAPEFKVEPIEEHATFMWENSYLKAIGPTAESGAMDITRKTAGLINELEKAHIYIEQLNQRLKALEARLETVK